jgi:hypothetical protein
MKHFATFLLAAAICATALPAMAEEANHRSCGVSMVKGTYMISLEGTRPAPRVLPGLTATPGTKESVTGVFLHVFDGKGSFYQPPPITVKGEFSGLFPDQPGTGTYEVAANCTGSFTVNLPQLPAPLQVQMVVLDHGRRLKAVVVSPQTLMIAVEGRRIGR